MEQLSFIDSPQPAPIVNVAMVPQRSPFRYPGGKTWLVPRLREWLASLSNAPKCFVEPFAGGGIISLTVAFERLAEHIIMVELDPQVAATWQTIIDGDAVWLAERIAAFDLTPESVEVILSEPVVTIADRAFQTILKNRVNRGGILAQGAGKIKTGENGRGLKSRWYPQTLKQRILDIVSVRERISFIEGDGLEVMRAHMHRRDVVFFIDPPYTAGGKRAGSRLYTHAALDHEELFQLAAKLTGDFLMTYDNAPELYDLARRYGFDTQRIAMKNTHHTEMTELLIGRDLDWAR
ncbi:DNA adenine methylase [Candidatus Gracilibacteria bacterium]|nr:DNA adenine methylase [Candidatus Gracilibacteria bacterium]